MIALRLPQTGPTPAAGARGIAVMTGLGRGFALALAMLIGALSLTSILALGLQRHALKRQPTAADFSPSMDAIVDPSGWPRQDKVQPQPSELPRVELGRSRLPAASSETGA